MDIEAYLRSSLENPLSEDENQTSKPYNSIVKSSQRRKRNQRKARKENHKRKIIEEGKNKCFCV